MLSFSQYFWWSRWFASMRLKDTTIKNHLKTINLSFHCNCSKSWTIVFKKRYFPFILCYSLFWFINILCKIGSKFKIWIFFWQQQHRPRTKMIEMKKEWWCFIETWQNTENLDSVDCVLMIYCVLNNNTNKLFLIEHMLIRWFWNYEVVLPSRLGMSYIPWQ